MRRSIVLFAVPLTLIAVVAACSSSSPSASAPTTPDAAVSGVTIACGTSTCPSTDVCCFNSTSPTCQPTGGCPESFLACSSKAGCPSSQVCCFTYENETGAASGPFTAQCQDSCPSSSYQLCATKDDCPAGDTCNPAQYAPYCGVGFDGNLAGFLGDGGLGGFFGDGGLAGFLGDGGLGGFLGNLFPDSSTTTPTDAAGGAASDAPSAD
jgi:hypothetical protein